MNCTQKTEEAIALSSRFTAYTGYKIRTPQRKARYNDKTRIRHKDAKEWALRRSGCSDTAEIKKYLKILGKKLDLRLTSAWIAVNLEFADAIKSLQEEVKLAQSLLDYDSNKVPKWSVGDQVEWTGYQPMQADNRRSELWQSAMEKHC